MNRSLLGEVEAWIGQGMGGRILTETYTARVDGIIRGVFESECHDSGLALIATGGYGRGELAPFSDIDLMFFADKRSNTGASERVLYSLWDTGFDISHSFRTARECVEEAFKDVRTRTSLLEARFIAGDRDLFGYFTRTVYPEIAFKRRKEFLRDKLREMEERHLSSGDSVFLLEPHIKEGEGGLRDIHTSYWLSRVVLKTADFARYLELMDPYERKRFSDAYDFLLRTRYCLHVVTGRRNDVLSAEYQKDTARLLGFRDSGRFKATERMLRYYYLKSRIIKEAARRVVVACSSHYVPVYRDMLIRKVTGAFAVSRGRLISTGGENVASDPVRIMESFYLCSKTGKKLSDSLKENIKSNLVRINSRTRNSAGCVHHFLRILGSPRVYETLREMHELGVLGRFLPEFGALRLLVVHEPYHMYTVDEHTLVAIRNLEALRTSKYRNLEDLHLIFNEVEDHETLFMAILFHDIGKAAGRRHEEEGYKRLKGIMERFNLDPDRRGRVEFIVRNHILMSRTALRREPEDPEVVAAFADAVGNKENLKAIYLVTYADMSAVNPAFYNSWKAYLLRELYENTLKHLAGIREGREEYLDRLAASLPKDVDATAFMAFVEQMPERYLLSTVPERVIEDYQLVDRMRREGFALGIGYAAPDGVTELSVCAEDFPGLFSKLAGFLSSKGLDIVNGRVFTGRSGVVIDRISISNWHEVWWDGLPADLEEGLKAIIVEKKQIVLGSRSRRKESPFDVFIELDNETSDELTVIEVFSPDRTGLLFEVTDVMHRKGLDVLSARINTEAGLAEDLFYVQTGNAKLDYEDAQEVLSELWITLTRQ